MLMLRDRALSAPDPALASLWMVRIPFDSSVTFLAAEDCSPTFPKIPAEARFANGEQRYRPGFKDLDGVSISFYETYDYKVSEWLKLWQRKIYYKGVYGLPKDYMSDIVVTLYSKHKSSPIRTITYKGAWITDRGPYQLNYSDETGRVIVQAQFAVDDVDERS